MISFRTLLTALLFAFFSSNVYAQPAWQELKSDIINSYSNSFINCLARSANGQTIYAGTDSGVIKFDGYGWSRMGSITTYNGAKNVSRIVSDASGNIYICGYFTNVNNNSYVAKWNGSSWIELGNGGTALNPNNLIRSIACDNNGNVYAAGSFTNASGKYYVAKWNGANWSEPGALQANAYISSIAVDGIGNVYAGGSFTNASGKYYVAKWNGITWTEPGLLNANAGIISLTVDATGNIYTSGVFTNASGKYYVAKWNGILWEELGTGANSLNPNSYIYTLLTDAAGNVYAAGGFNTGGYVYVAKWNGTNWAEVGAGANPLHANNVIYGLTADASGKLYATGGFNNSSGFKYVASFDPLTNKWGTAGTNATGTLYPDFVDGTILKIIADKAGNIYEVGCGSTIRKWNGLAWDDLVSANNTPTWSSCLAGLAIDSTGNLYATGGLINGNNTSYIAKWDGSSWTNIATISAVNGQHIGALVIDKAGNIYAMGLKNASGAYCVSKWDGSTWTPLNNGAINFTNWTNLAMDHHGDLYVTLWDDQVFHPYVIKWNGSAWVRLGDMVGSNSINSNDPILSIIFDPSNNLYVGATDGLGFGLNYIRKFDGTTWSTVGSTNYFQTSQIFAMTTDKYGTLYAVGNSPGFARVINKWNGVEWKVLGDQTTPWQANDFVQCLIADDNGTLYTGGEFTNSNHSTFIAYYSGVHDLCPPAASTIIKSDLTGSSYQWKLNTGSGFSNLTDNGVYSGSSTQTLQLNNIPSSAYGYEYKCITDGLESFTFKIRFVDTWKGTGSPTWEDPNNWSCGTVPDANTDVLFNSGYAIINSDVIIRTLTALSGVSININSGMTLTITH